MNSLTRLGAPRLSFLGGVTILALHLSACQLHESAHGVCGDVVDCLMLDDPEALEDADPKHGRGGSDGDALLVGRAILPADTFAEGPPSGEAIGRSFPSQPVQGFSAVLAAGSGELFALSDNGFGSFENSADYHLRVYRIAPNLRTRRGGTGEVEVLGFFELRDPNHQIKFAITNHFTPDRILTGADFDVESFQRAPDGTFWFGDEFGPFLVHTDDEGVVLEPPVPLPDFERGDFVRAPQNPYLEEGSAVRVMNAVRAHARMHGASHVPVFSPWHVHVVDGDASGNRGFNGQRDEDAVVGTGLVPANDEVFNVAQPGLPSLQRAGYPVVTWTVNDPTRMLELMELGVDGIISDRPDLLRAAVDQFDAAHPEAGILDADGLIDVTKFDAQGHRGGRNLRPENTIPAMEVALDTLMATLELDCGLTADGVPVLYHDRELQGIKSRRKSDPARLLSSLLPEYVQDATLADLQDPIDPILNDGVFRGAPQSNDPALSPASRAYFASVLGRPDPGDIYLMPSLAQVLDFVTFYAEFYAPGGAGRTGELSEGEYERRHRNALRVRFNVETKLNPRHPATTKTPEEFVDAIAGLIEARGLESRADVQSFDFRTLLLVHERFPSIRTVFLFGDFSLCPTGQPGGTFCDDGTNMQPLDVEAPVTEALDDENNTPWMAGLFWPYRRTLRDFAHRAQTSGGFEGMAISPNGQWLYPLLEKPLDGVGNGLLIHRFNVRRRRYTGTQFTYPLDARGVAIGEFVLYGDRRGLIIERDGTQGDLGGFKQIFQVELGRRGGTVAKEPLVDLLRIDDPWGLSSEDALPGDVGLGDPFAFPFVTIESVIVFDHRHIGVLNDNNFPFSVGRHVGAGLPDDNEVVLLRLGRPLD